jgi:hypothetical protein
VRRFISVPRSGDFSGPAFLGTAFRRTQVGLSWVRLFLGAAIYFRTQERRFLRSGFPGYGEKPYPGRSFLGTAFPGCGDLFPHSGTAFFLGTAICRTQVGLFQGTAFPGCGDLFPHSGTAIFLGTAIRRTQVGLFQGTAFPGCGDLFPHSGTAIFLGTAIRRTQVGLFQGTAFPGSGFSWVRLFLGVRRFASSSPGPAFSQVRLFPGPAFFPVKEQLLE